MVDGPEASKHNRRELIEEVAQNLKVETDNWVMTCKR